jgi:DnaJ-class molecular chaperone
MAVKRVRCPCRGKFECKLCNGTKYYLYEVGPRGWMPFPCPTCDGKGTLPPEPGETEARPCITCHGDGSIDPANPPYAEGMPGLLRKLWKIFFGG